MKPAALTIVSVFLIMGMPNFLFAKGVTVKITLLPAAAAPIDIVDPSVRQFDIWSGPGLNGDYDKHGFIVDWEKPVAKGPAGLLQYKVSFYIECDRIKCGTDTSLAYVVYYRYDPPTKQGFVYLPGRGSEFAQLNTKAILHGPGYEGHWFRASKAWDNFVTPIIAKVSTARALPQNNTDT